MSKWRPPKRPFLNRVQLFHLADQRAEQRRALAPSPYDTPGEIRMIELLFAARDGDFHALGEVVGLMKQQDDDLFWNGASTLLSYAAPGYVLRGLISEFSREIFVEKDAIVQNWIAETLLNSGLLWTVPEALRIMTAQSERANFFAVPARLSFLLEGEEAGPVFAGPPEIPEAGDFPEWYERDFTYDDPSYVTLVRAVYESRLTAASRAENTAFFFGQEVAIEGIALRLLETLPRAQDDERVARARSVLEAQTGVDLTGFYRNAVLDRLTAVAAVEKLFDTVNLSGFVPGQRYFFGRPVPD